MLITDPPATAGGTDSDPRTIPDSLGKAIENSWTNEPLRSGHGPSVHLFNLEVVRLARAE